MTTVRLYVKCGWEPSPVGSRFAFGGLAFKVRAAGEVKEEDGERLYRNVEISWVGPATEADPVVGFTLESFP